MNHYRYTIATKVGEIIVGTNRAEDRVVLTLQNERATVSMTLTIAQACEVYGALDVAIDRLEEARNDAADWAALTDAQRGAAYHEFRREMEDDERKGAAA